MSQEVDDLIKRQEEMGRARQKLYVRVEKLRESRLDGFMDGVSFCAVALLVMAAFGLLIWAGKP